MFAVNFGKRIFYLFPVFFLVFLILPETNVNAQQNPPAPVYNKAECEQIYKAFLEVQKFASTPEERKKAIQAARQFIEKCNVPENKEIIDYLEKQPGVIHRPDAIAEIVKRFNNAVKDAKNIDAKEAFAAGKELLVNYDPNLIDVMLVLASIGFDQAATRQPVNTFNDEAISYAKQAIRKIESGATSKQYGAWSFSYKTREDALAWMNYTIGYIEYYSRRNRKEAIPYLYRATLYETGTPENPKNSPNIYQAIGDYYKDEYNRLDEERTGLARQAMGKSSEAELKPLRDKAKELLARQRKFGERIFDAYARAYHLAGQDKAYRDNLYQTLKILYGFIFDGKRDGFDEYLKSVINSPMLEPPVE